jgi:hypothetical protein
VVEDIFSNIATRDLVKKPTKGEETTDDAESANDYA